LFWADLASSPFRTTDCAEEDGGGGFSGFEGVGCEGLAGCVDGALGTWLSAYILFSNLGECTYPTEKMLLKVEFTCVGASGFNDF